MFLHITGMDRGLLERFFILRRPHTIYDARDLP